MKNRKEFPLATECRNDPRRLVRGFTLIEILIAMAVIGILASLVLVGLGSVRPAARDTRRVSDLRQVQLALELYFRKNGAYPVRAGSDDWSDLVSALQGAQIGTPNIPDDPQSGGGKHYGYASDGSSYVLFAALEDPNDPSLDSDTDGTDALGLGVNCEDPVYCVVF